MGFEFGRLKDNKLMILLVVLLVISLFASMLVVTVGEASETFSLSRVRARSLEVLLLLRCLPLLLFISALLFGYKNYLVKKLHLNYRSDLGSEIHKNSPPLLFYLFSFPDLSNFSFLPHFDLPPTDYKLQIKSQPLIIHKTSYSLNKISNNVFTYFYNLQIYFSLNFSKLKLSIGNPVLRFALQGEA